MLLLTTILWIPVFACAVEIKPPEVTEDWERKCSDVMAAENLLNNFSVAVAHGTHSITLQDVRLYRIDIKGSFKINTSFG